MTFYEVYVARADDPAYTRELDPCLDQNEIGCPDALSPVSYGRDGFYRIYRMVKNEELPGKQTDGGCWVAIVDKSQALGFFKDVSLSRQMASFLQTLKDDRRYALVARES